MTHEALSDPAGLVTGAFPLHADAADAAALFDVALDLLVIRDLDGRVLRASSSWYDKLGHRPQDMVGNPLLSFVHPEDLPGTLDSVIEVKNRKPGDPVHG